MAAWLTRSFRGGFEQWESADPSASLASSAGRSPLIRAPLRGQRDRCYGSRLLRQGMGRLACGLVNVGLGCVTPGGFEPADDTRKATSHRRSAPTTCNRPFRADAAQFLAPAVDPRTRASSMRSASLRPLRAASARMRRSTCAARSNCPPITTNASGASALCDGEALASRSSSVTGLSTIRPSVAWRALTNRASAEQKPAAAGSRRDKRSSAREYEAYCRPRWPGDLRATASPRLGDPPVRTSSPRAPARRQVRGEPPHRPICVSLASAASDGPPTTSVAHAHRQPLAKSRRSI